jgi:hypothetical protein
MPGRGLARPGRGWGPRRSIVDPARANGGWGRRPSHRSTSALGGARAVVALPVVVNGRVRAVDDPDPGLGRRRTVAAAAHRPLRSRPPCGVAAVWRTPSRFPTDRSPGPGNGTCRSMPIMENWRSPRWFSTRCRRDRQIVENDSAAGRFSRKCMLRADAGDSVSRAAVRGPRSAGPATCTTSQTPGALADLSHFGVRRARGDKSGRPIAVCHLMHVSRSFR